MLGLLIAYETMVLAHVRGPDILLYLWGEEVLAEAQTDEATAAVQPDLTWAELCEGYSDAHFHTYSNILHAGAMIASLVLFIMALLQKTSEQQQQQPRWSSSSLLLLLWIPPVFYLPAWAGHFIFQKDIPAFFTYGTTVRGWLSGEACSWWELILGETIETPGQLVLAMIVCNLLLFIVVTPEETIKEKRD